MKWAEAKKERIQQVLNFIKERKATTEKEIIGHFVLEWGLTRRKIREYLTDLRDAGEITVETKTTPVGSTTVVVRLSRAVEQRG